MIEKEGFLLLEVGTRGWEGRRERMCGTRTEPNGICERGERARAKRGSKTHVNVGREEERTVRDEEVERKDLERERRVVV